MSARCKGDILARGEEKAANQLGVDISHAQSCHRRLKVSEPNDNHHFNMTKHSKNNTASSIFSYAEYKKLDYGTKRVSLKLISAWYTHRADMNSNV